MYMIDVNLIQATALVLGIGLGSGINIYATIALLGIYSATGNFVLPEGLEVLQDPLVITAAIFMYVVEFFADKIPGFDSLWDALHTFIRIPLGALLAGDVMASSGPAMEVVGTIIGGSLATATHFTKSGTRALINTSPEPVTNWTASITEDIAVFTGLWAAINHPIVWIIISIIIILITIWVIPKLWRGIKFIINKIKQLFSKKKINYYVD